MNFDPFEVEIDDDQQNVITVTEAGLEYENVLVEWDAVRDLLARAAERYRKTVKLA